MVKNHADNCDYFKTSAKQFWSKLLEEILLPVFLVPIVIALFFSTMPQAFLWLFFSGVLAISEIFLVLYGPRFFLGLYDCTKKTVFGSK